MCEKIPGFIGTTSKGDLGGFAPKESSGERPAMGVRFQFVQLGIVHNRDRLQKLTGALARHCKGRQAGLSLKKGETLRGKRVLIGIDGGRTRMLIHVDNILMMS